MIVRQEESTPIGDFFHDSGVSKVFTALETTVDDFEVNRLAIPLQIENM